VSSTGELPPDLDPTRQCSRCREFFPLTDTPDEVDHPSWWLCGPCHERLIGTIPSSRR